MCDSRREPLYNKATRGTHPPWVTSDATVPQERSESFGFSGETLSNECCFISHVLLFRFDVEEVFQNDIQWTSIFFLFDIENNYHFISPSFCSIVLSEASFVSWEVVCITYINILTYALKSLWHRKTLETISGCRPLWNLKLYNTKSKSMHQNVLDTYKFLNNVFG